MKLTTVEQNLLWNLLRHYHFNLKDSDIYILDSEDTLKLFNKIHKTASTWTVEDGELVHFSVYETTNYFLNKLLSK
jgi:hypothetical protein